MEDLTLVITHLKIVYIVYQVRLDRVILVFISVPYVALQPLFQVVDHRPYTGAAGRPGQVVCHLFQYLPEIGLCPSHICDHAVPVVPVIMNLIKKDGQDDANHNQQKFIKKIMC